MCTVQKCTSDEFVSAPIASCTWMYVRVYILCVSRLLDMHISQVWGLVHSQPGQSAHFDPFKPSLVYSPSPVASDNYYTNSAGGVVSRADTIELGTKFPSCINKCRQVNAQAVYEIHTLSGKLIEETLVYSSPWTVYIYVSAELAEEHLRRYTNNCLDHLGSLRGDARNGQTGKVVNGVS